MRPVRFRLWPVGLLFLNGCAFTSSQVDSEILAAAMRSDVQVGADSHVAPPAPTLPPPSVVLPPVQPAVYQPAPEEQAPKSKDDRPPPRLEVPGGLPGADAPMVETPKTREELNRAFPPIPPLPAPPPLAQGPEGHPLSLADLQHMAEQYSPQIKSAAASVEAARGAARQAGMYPNPSVFFEQDTVQTFQAGYQGMGFDQVIKTGGKLKFQQAAAVMDLLNTKLALRRAQSDLRYAIRGAYYNVLVARESARVSEALFRFTDQVYRRQVNTMFLGGLAASYEPMQLRPLVLQARLAILQARNSEQAAWKQLAAAVGVPHLPPTELQGRVDAAVPEFDFKAIEAGLVDHTDFLTALNSLQKARYSLELAKLVPVPDVDVRVLVQKDYTTPPFQVAHSFSVSVPVPIWDQNRGGIYQAKAQLAQASVGPEVARNNLTSTLADAWNRYLTARATVETTQQQIRDQVRVYRRVYAAHDVDPDRVGFGDIVTAQQTLATYIANYISALGLQWQAVVDLSNIVQTNDLYATRSTHEVMPIPDLQRLVPTDPLPAWGKHQPIAPTEVHPAPQQAPTPETPPTALPTPLPVQRREGGS
jgi:outer membrane protein, heavy metal efflux system